MCSEAEKKEKRGLLMIMDKLNQENEGMQRKKKLYPPLFSDAAAEKAKVYYSTRYCNNITLALLP